MEIIIVLILTTLIIALLVLTKKTPDELDKEKYGPLNPNMICSHCNALGKIRTKAISQKKGISGGKATAALLTGGISMLATGLSRKEINTQAHCMHCSNTWFF